MFRNISSTASSRSPGSLPVQGDHRTSSFSPSNDRIEGLRQEGLQRNAARFSSTPHTQTRPILSSTTTTRPSAGINRLHTLNRLRASELRQEGFRRNAARFSSTPPISTRQTPSRSTTSFSSAGINHFSSYNEQANQLRREELRRNAHIFTSTSSTFTSPHTQARPSQNTTSTWIPSLSSDQFSSSNSGLLGIPRDHTFEDMNDASTWIPSLTSDQFSSSNSGLLGIPRDHTFEDMNDAFIPGIQRAETQRKENRTSPETQQTPKRKTHPFDRPSTNSVSDFEAYISATWKTEPLKQRSDLTNSRPFVDRQTPNQSIPTFPSPGTPSNSIPHTREPSKHDHNDLFSDATRREPSAPLMEDSVCHETPPSNTNHLLFDSDASSEVPDDLTAEDNASLNVPPPPTDQESPSQTNQSDGATAPAPRPKNGPRQKLKALIFKIFHVVKRLFKKEKAAGVPIDGADFIVQSILKNVEPQTIELVKEGDPGIFGFILTKAIYILTFGDGRDQQIPSNFYFKEETIQKITSLRREIHSRNGQKQLHLNDNNAMRNLFKITNDYPAYQDGSSNINTKSLFNRIKEIASEELQGGNFFTNHYNPAVQLLSVNEETAEST